MATASLPSYNISPTAQTGQGAYGKVPGNIGLPPSLYEESLSAVPGLSGLVGSAGTDIASQLAGTLSPSTMMNIGNYAAGRGVSMGQPNSPIMNEIGMGLTGTTTEGLQQQGIYNTNALLGTVGQQQLSPDLTSTIAQWNSTMNAAPDPAAAVSAEQSWIKQYMDMLNPPGAGSGGSFTASSNPFSQFPMFKSPSGGTGNTGAVNYNQTNPYTVYDIGSPSDYYMAGAQ